MPREYLFTVSNGKVDVKVTGVAGPDCTKLPSAVAKNLGAKPVATEYTDEFYQQPGAVQVRTSVQQAHCL